MANHEQLMWAEVDDIGKLLHDLSDAEWDAPSLCEGWRVRDVIGHMCYGHTTSMPGIVAGAARYRGDVAEGSFNLSKQFADARTPAELLDVWDRELVAKRTRHGISRVIRRHEAFIDHFIHHQDIRRPLGRPRDIPEDRLVAALDLLPKVNNPFFSTRKPTAGLALRATDVGWAHGAGPEVAGPGEALVLAAAGRRAAFADLAGEGVPQLAQRVGAA